MLAHGSGICYVSYILLIHRKSTDKIHTHAQRIFWFNLPSVLFDPKPVSQVFVPVDGQGSSFENQTSNPHTQNKFINDFHILAPSYFSFFLCYVCLTQSQSAECLYRLMVKAALLRTRHQLGSHTQNVCIMDFENLVLNIFSFGYVSFDGKPFSRLLVPVDG